MEHIVSFDLGAMMAKPCARGPLIAAPGGGPRGSCPSQFSIFVTIAAMSRLAVLAAKLQALACHTTRVKEWQDDVVFLAKVAGPRRGGALGSRKRASRAARSRASPTTCRS
jgi:hypothetical protein